jgi:hypothetical protein
VATGYFLTGDLVLTTSHVAQGRDSTFSVRAEVGGPAEADHWSSATPQWIGAGHVDAMLLRTERPFGNWDLPAITSAESKGTWESAGYPKAANDPGQHNRKTLPLDGTFGLSLGQGPVELALSLGQNIATDWASYWKGVSGAPVFANGDGAGTALIGIISKANAAFANALLGLPAIELLDDIHFRTAINQSFLGPLPAIPFCLVLTAEAAAPELNTAADLVEQTAGVLKGFHSEEVQFQNLHTTPVHISVLKAVESPENWAATIGALAKAEYLIADVTGFESATMLLLGIRSVLRRGVTITVTRGKAEPMIEGMPFNITEIKVLSCGDENFYDHLHVAMAEGAANLRKDANYLDLPAYHAIRAPRPDSWADNDGKDLLVLCPFSEDYSALYSKLRPIIRAHTGNKNPMRMLDLRSPRLVGQAVYEQIRWSSWCLADWTGWRPNVFFELGVRLACSGRDPLCIAGSGAAQGSGGLKQRALLARLFGLATYDQDNPRPALAGALESWPSPPSPGNGRKSSEQSLPPAATFKVAQANFQWHQESILLPPHTELRNMAELIFGKDQDKIPELLFLFAENDSFNAALNAAVRERWVAAWLYIRHIYQGQAIPDERMSELTRFAQFAEYALRSSDDPRHVRLRNEITRFLARKRPRQRSVEGGKRNE